ncbi:MAG: NINE protein [Bacteroidetes bacterium]|nr:MAG: NINE protein [Bacteroidota bacterium]
MKKKHVAGILALFMGILGVHRYYLGQRLLGAFYTFAFFISLIITIEEGVPAVMFPAILGFIDSILFFVMPKEDFDERYNKKKLKRKARTRTTSTERKFSHQKQTDTRPVDNRKKTSELQTLKKEAIELFRDYEFEEAVDLFEEASQLAPNDPSIHFNLACCYSMIEEAELSYNHLQKAVENGFDATNKIHSHTALAYLRTHPEFEQFVQNGFKVVKALPTPQESLLDTKPEEESPEKEKPTVEISEEDDLLTQIAKLGDLLEQGVLTQEEFAIQKQKLLENL